MQNIYLLNKNSIKDISIGLELDEITLNKQKDKDLYIATRLVENYVLNGREKHINENGKPFAIDGSKYNLSQVGDYACAFEADEECGIDIAKEQEFSDHFKERLFSDRDKVSLDTNLDVLRAWTIKEACVKCEGVGLKGIFDVEIISANKCKFHDIEYNYKSFFFDNYCISVVLKGQIEVDSISELMATDFNK